MSNQLKPLPTVNDVINVEDRPYYMKIQQRMLALREKVSKIMRTNENSPIIKEKLQPILLEQLRLWKELESITRKTN